MVKTAARHVEKGFTRSQMQIVDYFQSFAPTPSSVCVENLAVVAILFGLKIFHLEVVRVAQVFVGAKLDHEICMKLPGGCDDRSTTIVCLNPSQYGTLQSGRQ
ncbi:unnamed protein product [Laminaria digitata]